MYQFIDIPMMNVAMLRYTTVSIEMHRDFVTLNYG